MKNFLKKFLVFLGIIATVSLTTNFTTPAPVSAREYGGSGSCDSTFLGLVPWDCNAPQNIDSQEDLVTTIAAIASNILTDLSIIAAYLILFYVMYGGFLYMTSTGEPGKTATAKKTLTNAFIGLGIVISAYTIFSAIRIAIAGNNASFQDCTISGCVEPTDLVANLIRWLSGIIGVVAAIFVLVGAWGYITANGEPNKLQKAKMTIFYALIGLVVFALSQLISAFVSQAFREANDGSDSNSKATYSIIANINKESHEDQNI